MSKSNKRKHYNTTLDKQLCKKIKIIAADNDKKQNRLLEEAIKLVIERYIHNKGLEIHDTDPVRINKNTTIDRDLIHRLNQLKARTDINANLLLEEGMRLVVAKYSDKYTRGASYI